MNRDLHVLIVDDEKMVREGIVATLPWEELHLKVVGTAANGRDALSLIRNLKPHIVLTDIRMPFLDGLGLMEAIQQEAPQIKTIILSAYDEFEYARKALKLGAVDYLIKPIQAEELVAVLRRVVELFQEDVKREVFFGDIRRKVREDFPIFLRLLKEEGIGDLVKTIEKLFPFPESEAWKAGRDILTILIQELHIHAVISSAFMEELLSDVRTASELLHSHTDLEVFVQVFAEKLQGYVGQTNRPTVPVIIQKVLAYVQERYAEPISVQGIAKRFGLNPDYFSHLFKLSMGVNFIEYLNRYRIDRAEELIVKESLKIYEVAERVGFPDYKYFSRLFHQWKGYRPTDIRKKY